MVGEPAPPLLRTPHALLPLFPQFLRRRRRGFVGIAAILAESGLSRPALFLLVRIAEQGERATKVTLRPGAPYTTRDPHLPWLDEAIAAGYVERGAEDRVRLTPGGVARITRLEREATAYLAQLGPLPAAELARLADLLDKIMDGLDRQAGGPDAHLYRAERIAALAPDNADAPLVRIERVIVALWLARDDAHIGAWRIAHFPPPHLSVLTQLWHGEADTLAALETQLAAAHTAETIAELIEELAEQGYVEWKAGAPQPTRAGYNVREAIESDTDDLYFRQWPPLSPDDLSWIHATLTRLVAALPEGEVTQS
jgi:hypothetical protein